MVSIVLCRFDEARAALNAVLAYGEAIGSQFMQYSALDNLAIVAAYQGHWQESAKWAECMRALAEPAGALRRLACAQGHLAAAAEALDDRVAALHWHHLALSSSRGSGSRTLEAESLQRLGVLQREQGDVRAGPQWHAQAQALYEALGDPVGASESAAYSALCALELGQSDEAQVSVTVLLDRLDAELADRPAHELIRLRWICLQVLEARGEPGAGPLLDRLAADLQARAAELTDTADRDRLIRALPVFRSIDVAWRARSRTSG
jgi:hypothetical protein